MAKESKAFEFGPFRLEVRERRLTREGYSVPLRGRVFDTLYALVSRHGCLVTKDELMAAIWPDSVVEETNLNHNICVIRRALGEKATGQKYVETVPRQGYRFVADVRELDDPAAYTFPRAWDIREPLSPSPEPTGAPARISLDSQSRKEATDVRQQLPPAARRQRYGRQRIFSLLVVSALLIAGYFGVGQLGLKEGSSDSRLKLAVLPFENLTGDSSQKYIADGFSHEILSQLGRWNPSRVGVIARTSAGVYGSAQKSIAEIGRELGVDYIVEGSVRRNKDHYRITVMLIRVDDQAHLWAANYSRTPNDVTALQIEVARVVASEIGRTIGVDPDENYPAGYPQTMETQPRSVENKNTIAATGNDLSVVVPLALSI